MPKISFQHVDKSIEADEGEWMYEVVERAEGGIPFACKAGACGTCATPVVEGIDSLGKVSAREARTLTELGLDLDTYRLPCLKDVGASDVVWGRPHSAADADTELGTHEVVVESYRPLNLTVAELRFFVDKADFHARPGQYMIFHIPDAPRTVRRSYSISTPPSDTRHFEICVRAVAGGYGSNYVHRLRPGERLAVEGPYGDFVLDEASERDIIMIATGTGIAPIKAMLMHLLDKRSKRRVRLFFGLRHETDLFYTDLLRGLAAHYPALEYWITLSQADPARWAGPRGRVTDLIDTHVSAADAATSEVYLCGGRPMIESSTAALRALGFSADTIHYERFF
ncbi:FAD-binding oxidoreductase [Haliangium sp.]|uniref:FAD-binding oxidoreductase n=1 Tax=Haliangium sp. TaxID=2663208 RepID=UPI003D1076DE